MRKVVVVPHDPQWATQFVLEADRIKGALGANLLSIYHIGSTAVPGLQAKPIIDIMPVVRDVAALDCRNEEMLELGYEALGEYGIVGRRYFRRIRDGRRTHHVHAFQYDNYRDIVRHLAVADYLRARPDEASAYGALKERLAQDYPSDWDQYVDGKDAFVGALERRALAWYLGLDSEAQEQKKAIEED